MWMVALILGCSGKGTPVQDDTDSVVDTGTPWPDDTDAGTDEDADGWTVEEGDCDDTNIYVNPARDEDIADGLDNDCDGRVDEQFSGIVALQVGDGVTNPHKIVGVYPLGAERFSVDIQATEMAPYFLTWGVNGGWLVGDLANAALWTVAEDGSVTELTNFMGTLTETMRGLTTHPDGYYLVTTIDSLQKVDAVTGEKEELANFLTLPEDPPNSDLWLLSFDTTVDYSTGDIGIIGLYGGLAIFRNDTQTLDTLWQFDPDADLEFSVWSGNHRDNGGWYMGGQDIEGWGMFRFNETEGSWKRRTTWDQEWEPHFMTVDGDSGDFFLSTAGGQYPYLWKVAEDGLDTSVFFPVSGTLAPGTSWWDLYCTY